MRLTTLARRYAGALFETAKGAGRIDKVESDLGLLTYSMQTMPKLKEALNHPLIPADRKKAIAAEVFGQQVEEITLSFLGLLIDKRREQLLEDAETEYVRLANVFRGIVPATVTSAVPLTDDEKSRLKDKLQVFTGQSVELNLEEDPAIIGGIIVRIGDTVIDGSVRGDLASLRDRLLGHD